MALYRLVAAIKYVVLGDSSVIISDQQNVARLRTATDDEGVDSVAALQHVANAEIMADEGNATAPPPRLSRYATIWPRPAAESVSMPSEAITQMERRISTLEQNQIQFWKVTNVELLDGTTMLASLSEFLKKGLGFNISVVSTVLQLRHIGKTEFGREIVKIGVSAGLHECLQRSVEAVTKYNDERDKSEKITVSREYSAEELAQYKVCLQISKCLRGKVPNCQVSENYLMLGFGDEFYTIRQAIDKYHFFLPIDLRNYDYAIEKQLKKIFKEKNEEVGNRALKRALNSDCDDEKKNKKKRDKDHMQPTTSSSTPSNNE